MNNEILQKQIDELKKKCLQLQTEIILPDEDDSDPNSNIALKNQEESLNKDYQQTLAKLQQEYSELINDNRTVEVIQNEIEENEKLYNIYQEENQKLVYQLNCIKQQHEFYKNQNYYKNMIYFWNPPPGMFPYMPQQFPTGQYPFQPQQQK